MGRHLEEVHIGDRHGLAHADLGVARNAAGGVEVGIAGVLREVICGADGKGPASQLEDEVAHFTPNSTASNSLGSIACCLLAALIVSDSVQLNDITYLYIVCALQELQLYAMFLSPKSLLR
jgi:hypothetical protein